MYTHLLVADPDLATCRLLHYTIQRVFGERLHFEYVQTPTALYNRLSEGQSLPQLLLVDDHFTSSPSTAVEVLTWIQQQEHLRGLVVKVWASSDNEEQAALCRRLGAQAVLSKLDALFDIVNFVKALVQ